MKQVAVIGAGVIGTRLCRSFSAHNETMIRYVCDLDLDKAKSLADQYGAEAITSYQKALHDEGIDIVYIGVPPSYHSEIAVAALNAGKHVICEKPIASNSQESKKIIDAKKPGLVTCINLPFRFSPAVPRMKEEMNNLGRLYQIELKFRFPQWPRPWQNVPWLKTRTQGGALREVGTHYFFGLAELFGKVDKVCALTSFESADSCENASTAIFSAKGIPGILSLIIGGIEPEENTLSIYGQNGVLQFEKWYLLKRIDDSGTQVLIEDRVNAELEMVDHFVKAIDGDKQAEEKLVSFEDAHKAQFVLEGFLESNGQWIELS